MIESGNEQAILPLTIGEEFILWAEQYWALKGAYESRALDVGAESCPYDYVRMTFADKIDQLIKSRLVL